MLDIKTLIKRSAERHHDHLCPRQVLGVRMGQYAGELFGLELPQADKRLYAIVETDGCLIDGITAATECSCGHRTMHILDYGKTAVTFADTSTGLALRLHPAPTARARARAYCPQAPDRWHAQLEAYQLMPTEELLVVERVQLQISVAALISRHGLRVVCERCGEDIINEREVRWAGHILCKTCAGDGYYRVEEPVAAEVEPLAVFAVGE